jgi:putative transcriptional regulator
MIRHHPSDAILVAHASGTLPVLHQEVVKLHLAQCTSCRAHLRLGHELGGMLLDDEQPVALSDDALARAMARLDAAGSEAPPIAASAPTLTPLEMLTQGRHWRRIGYGMKLMPLVARDATGTRLDLIRVAPGIALPEHDHTGPELTCVLVGGFADESGEYHAGDLEEGDVGLNHQPRALADEECICLIATTGYLRAKSLIARLLHPVFGI